MTKQEFLELVHSKIIILDGATASNLQKKGMPSGVCPEQWILNHKDVLIDLQKEYIEAGTDILYAPTFTCNAIKLEEYGLKEKIASMNYELVELSKKASSDSQEKYNKPVYIAGDMTMTGQQLYPMGKLLFEELVDVYKEQVHYLIEAGVDLFAVETMMSLQECRAAVLAIKESCELPIMVSLTYNEDGRTLFGTDSITALLVLQSMGVDAVGINCSTGPDKMHEIIKEMKQYATVPILAKPNAGLPNLVNGQTIYDMNPETFAKEMEQLMDLGVSIVGGCCGTTPDHIYKLAEKAKNKNPSNIKQKKIRAVTTERSTLTFDLESRFLVVGERINPTGKKKLQAQLQDGNIDLILDMVEEQVKAGADILDINVGMNGIDEKETMLDVIYEITTMSNIPLCIDSSYVDVIEAALRIYPGRALINSISMETEKMERLLSIAKKYGAMFVLLPVSDAGLPKSLEEKKEIIQTILERAKAIGLSKEDIVVDALVNTIGANKTSSYEAMETIHYCKTELKLATICGLSNISFGLPQRQFVNSTFLAFAIKEGLTMAIANPSQELLMNTAFAADLLVNKEEADIQYIQRVSNRSMQTFGQEIQKKEEIKEKRKEQERKIEKINQNDSTFTDKTDIISAPIYEAVLKGNKKNIIHFVKQALNEGNKPSDILDYSLIPGIAAVGEKFDKQIYFLPQLISSAETMRTAVDYLEPFLQQGENKKKLGTIVVATVAGDIHDIGKNLVVLMLKNYGFEVYDLGKDIPSEYIIEKAEEYHADIIGLSALMTTTMMEMKQVIRLAKEKQLRAKIIIGGAVITQSFADEIGADGYSSDAQDAVRLVKKLLNISV